MAYCADLPLEVIKKLHESFQISIHYDYISSYLKEACELKKNVSLEDKLQKLDDIALRYFQNHPSFKTTSPEGISPEDFFRRSIAPVYFLLAVISGIVDNFAVEEMLIKRTPDKHYSFLSLNRRRGSRQRVECPQNRLAIKMERPDLTEVIPTTSTSVTVLSFPFNQNA